MAGKKWLLCGKCEKETWTKIKDRFTCECCECETLIFVSAAKMAQAKKKKEARTKKAKAMGTYESKSAKKERKEENFREIDKRYVWWIHSWRCMVPECGVWPVHAHHVERKSQGGSDRSVVPVCEVHHIAWIHGKGPAFCEASWRIDFKKQVLLYNSLYLTDVSGPLIDSLERFDDKNEYATT